LTTRGLADAAAATPFVYPDFTQESVAAVILRGPGAVGARELAEWINARVAAKFQRVTDVMITDDFPRNVAGKTLKRVLGEQYKRA